MIAFSDKAKDYIIRKGGVVGLKVIYQNRGGG